MIKKPNPFLGSLYGQGKSVKWMMALNVKLL